MNRRKEPCRNFQRGSCQYGDRCKFVHVSQQQSRPNSVGSVTQSTSQFFNTSQQQKPNPFGFGVQNSSGTKGTPNFGARYESPRKPFENKWTRSSSTTPTNSTQQTASQPQAAIHKCTDPQSCKQQIVEDFESELPLWRLTCYGHWKHLPCDIVGDISYEELRAAAYEDARNGLPLQALIERERNLYNSRSAEFDNLLRNPYVIPSSTTSKTYSFPGANTTTLSLGAQNNTPPSFSSFSQLGASTNIASSLRPSAPATPPNSIFGQSNLRQFNSQGSGGTEMKFGTSGVFGSQLLTQQPGVSPGLFGSRQPSGNSPGASTTNFRNGVTGVGIDQVSSAFNSSQFPSTTSNQSRVISDTIHQPSAPDRQEDSPDDGVWLQKQWAIGEIPIVAPPERFCS